MAALTKKTAAGFAKMLSDVEVLTMEQLAELAAASTAKLQEKLVSGEKPKPAKKAAAKKPNASVENSDEEAEAAAPKAESPHLKYNREWVAYVRAYSTAHGWEVSFQKKVTPRGGESYMEEKTGSVLSATGTHVFSDTGAAMSPSDSMALAKFYKDSNHEIWEAYVEEHPLPVTAPKAKKVIPVKAAAAAATVVPPPVVPRKLPVAAAPVAAALPKIAIAKVKKTAPKPAEASKAAEPKWVCPAEGMGLWEMDGKQYIRDSEDLVWTMAVNEDGVAAHDEWCGKWDEEKKQFDKTVADPRLALEDDA